MVTKTISNRVKTEASGAAILLLNTVFFSAVSSQKRLAQACRWLSIINKCS